MYYLRVIAGVFTLYTAEVEILVETPPKRATSPSWGPPPPRTTGPKFGKNTSISRQQTS